MANRFWVGGTGTWDASSTANWSATSGGAAGASAPTSADAVFFDANSGSGTCTTANGSVCAAATLDSATLGLTLGANHTCSGTFTFNQGILDLANNVLVCTTFASSNTNTRSISFGAGKIQLTGNSASVLVLTTSTGLTVSGSKLFESTYSGSTGTRTFALGSLGTGATEANAVNVSITAGTDIASFSTTRLCGSLNTTGFAGTLTLNTLTFYGNLIVSSGLTFGTVGTQTFAATSGTQQITTNGKALDFAIVQNSPGATVQLQDNLTMGSTRTFTLTNGTLDLNNQTLSTGIFSTNNSNTRAISFGTGSITLTGNNATIWAQGNATGFTYTGTPNIVCNYAGATGTRTITTGGGGGGSATTALNFSFTAGTDILSIAGSGHIKNLDFTGFAGTLNNGIRNLYGDLTISAGMTLVAGANATSFVSASGTQQITINGNTLDFPLTFNGVGSTFAFQDALTQGSTRNFTLTNGTVQLKNGVTSTVGAFVTSGTDQKFLQSTTLGSQATLSQASGTVSTSYLTIQDINATGGATWDAYVDQSNVDAGNNDGWDFGISPVIGGAEYTYQLRSFTQPRRF